MSGMSDEERFPGIGFSCGTQPDAGWAEAEIDGVPVRLDVEAWERFGIQVLGQSVRLFEDSCGTIWAAPFSTIIDWEAMSWEARDRLLHEVIMRRGSGGTALDRD